MVGVEILDVWYRVNELLGIEMVLQHKPFCPFILIEPVSMYTLSFKEKASPE